MTWGEIKREWRSARMTRSFFAGYVLGVFIGILVTLALLALSLHLTLPR